MKTFDRHRARSSPSKIAWVTGALAAVTSAGCFGDGGDGVSSPDEA